MPISQKKEPEDRIPKPQSPTELEPVEARQAEIIFDTRAKRKRYVVIIGIVFAVFCLTYLFAAS